MFRKTIVQIGFVAIVLVAVSLFITFKDKYFTSGTQQIKKGDEMLEKGKLNDAFYWYNLVRESDTAYNSATKRRIVIDSLKALQRLSP